MANLRRLVRIGEAGVVIILAGFALGTYRELSALRRLPVSLPSYQFDVLGETEAARTVSTRGTWINERGAPEGLLTTTIECRKARMECVESIAKVIFISGQGLLESQQMAYEVERWGDAEIVTKATPGVCATRQLVLDLKDRRGLTRVSKSEDKPTCREMPARTLELVAGYRVRAAPL